MFTDAELNIHARLPIGVEIGAIDLKEELDERVHALLREALHEHTLLLFRNQNLDRAELLRTVQIFGGLAGGARSSGGLVYLEAWIEGIERYKSAQSDQETERTGDVRVRSDGEMQFHFDGAFTERPPKATMLYGVEVPSEGGDTMFADVRFAYELLPSELRTKLTSLNIRHKAVGRDPAADHSLISQHPASGKPTLYFSPMHAYRIHGLAQSDSDALLNELTNYVKASVKYRHHWLRGDLIVFDNLALEHGRADFSEGQHRTIAQVWIE